MSNLHNKHMAHCICSLFCSKRVWAKVLANAVKPWVEQNINNVHAVYLGFNYQGGENIQFAFNCANKLKRTILGQLDGHLKDYFHNNPGPVKEYQLPFQGVFMPFPVNTVQYGLFTVPVGAESENWAIISKSISAAIICAFGNDEMTDEDVLVFAFYLRCGVFRAFKENFKNREDVLPDTCLPYAGYINEMQFNEIVYAFENCKDTLNDILAEVMFDPSVNAPAKWLTDFIAAVEYTILANNNLDLSGLQSAYALHQAIVRIINIQLGMNAYMQQVLNYFCTMLLNVPIANH